MGANRTKNPYGAGEVVAVGEGVTEFKLGDAVVSTFFWIGVMARLTYRVFHGCLTMGWMATLRPRNGDSRSECVHSCPIGWSPTEAATLTTAELTAWCALMEDAGIKAGDTVLIQGTGGVSIFALLFAKMAGVVTHFLKMRVFICPSISQAA